MRAPTAALLLLLAGCGQTTGADVLRALVWPIPVPDSLFESGETVRLAEWDRQEPRELPNEPALALRLGSSRRGVATLLQADGTQRLWRTNGGVVVATEGARVVATAGLERILAATRFDGPDPLPDAVNLGDRTARTWRIVDVMRPDLRPQGMRFGLRLECRMRLRQTEDPATVLAEESCHGAARFTNRFWLDAQTGAVYLSEQWVGEDMPLLQVEVLSAEAPAASPAR